MSVQTIFSPQSDPQWPQELARLYALPRRKPFEPAAMAFVGALSSRILRSALGRRFPELAALAHWFRPASVRDMARRMDDSRNNARIRPRGLVFALAPANVDVLFIYGWLLSLLTGNATVVRVSRNDSEVRDAFIELVEELAQEEEYCSALADSWIVTYEHDAAITRAFSQQCNARLIWGGDATVAEVRTVPLNPLAVEVAFADRFSQAVFDAEAVNNESDKVLSEIARRFANDTLWFAQQACSSPRAVLWVGNEAQIAAGRSRFWALYQAAADIFDDEPAAVMSRVSDLFALAAADAISGLGGPLAELPARALGTGPAEEARTLHSGYGLFVEYALRSTAQIPDYLSDKDQTLVAYGLSDPEQQGLVDALPNRALDRIVEPGEATEFATVWDGTDLFDVLTRQVTVTRRHPANQS